jgi:hypothetical protein
MSDFPMYHRRVEPALDDSDASSKRHFMATSCHF